MKPSFSFTPSIALFALALLAGQPAPADTITTSWTGGTTVWDTTTTNWNNGATSATSSAKFDAAFITTNQPGITVAPTTQGIWLATGVTQDVTITGVTSAKILTITGTATLSSQTNAGIILDDSANHNLTLGDLTTTTLTNSTGFYVNNTGTLTVAGGTGTLALGTSHVLTLGGTNASGTTVLAGVVTGPSSSLVINTAGTVTLSGGTSTFTGGATLTAGTVNVNKASAFGTTAGTLLINGAVNVNNTSGGSVTLSALPITIGSNFSAFAAGSTSTNNFSLGAGAITNAGDRTVTLNGTTTTLTMSGKMTNSAGAVQTTTVNGVGNTFSLGSYDLSNSGSDYINIINGTGNVTITGVVANGSTSTASGLTYSGSGVLQLNGASTFGGGLNLNNGSLTLGGSSVVTAGVIVSGPVGLGTIQVGTASQAVTLSTNATSSTTRTISNNISLNNDVVFATTTSTGRIALNVMNGLTTPNTVALTRTNQLTTNASVTVDLIGAISGNTFGITKTGTGTLNIGGGATTPTDNQANTYNGLTTVSGGLLNLNKVAGTDAIAGNVTIETAGTLAFPNAGEQIKDTATVTVNSGGAFSLGSKTETIGNLTVGSGFSGNAVTGSSGTLIIAGAGSTTVNSGGVTVTNLTTGTGDLTFGDGATVSSITTLKGNVAYNGTTTGATFGSGAITLNGNRTFTVANGSAATDLTVSGLMSDGTGVSAVTKEGAGALTLSAANTFTGGVTLNAGTLNINNAGVLGTSGSLGNGGTFLINAGTIDNTSGSAKVLLNVNPVTINGDFAFTGGTGTTHDLTLPGAVSLGTGAGTVRTITTNAGTLTFGGDIGDGAAGKSITKAGAGILVLSGANTYTGATTINGGILSVATLADINTTSGIGKGSTGGSADDLVFGGGTLKFAGSAAITNTNRLFTIGTASGNSATLDASPTINTNVLNFTNPGSISFVNAAPHSLTLTGIAKGPSAFTNPVTTASTFALLISDQSPGNATSVTKSGVGIWNLANASNSYSGGTTVTGGRLAATTLGALSTGDVTVANGGQVFLGGAGTYGNRVFIAGVGTDVGSNSTVGAVPGALVLNNGALLSGMVTLQADSRISATSLYNGSTGTGTISGQITGSFALSISPGGAAPGGTLTLSNPLNNWTGDTTISAGGTGSGSTMILSLGSSEVVPNGVSGGNLILANANPSGAPTFSLNGYNETINGLVSSGYGAKAVNNNGTANSILTLGDNNATANFAGPINNGASGTLAITKIGSGTQIFAAASNYSGATTISGGTLREDFNQTANSNGTNLSNYLSASTALKLAGGTFSILGRASGADTSSPGTTTSVSTTNTTLSLDSVIGLVVGQVITSSTGSIPVGTYIKSINTTDKTVFLSAGATAAGTATFTTVATTPTTSQTVNGLTVNPGASALVLDANGGAGTVLNLAAISRPAKGGTLDVTLPAGGQSTSNGLTTTTTTAANGVLVDANGSAYATIAGADWASIPASGTPRNISALASYNGNSFTSTDNADVTGSQSPGAFTANTLRFNTDGATLGLDPSGPSTVSTGGILVTAATAATGVSIDGSSTGTLRSGAGAELVIANYGKLAVGAPIVDSTAGASALTLSGGGTTTLSGANNYTGPTSVTGGTLAISGGINATASVSMTGGTLLLGASNVVNNAAGVDFGAVGKLSSGGFSEFVGLGNGVGANGTGAGLGALTLSGNSKIDFGASATNSILWFSGVGTITPGLLLTIDNWNGNLSDPGLGGGIDQLRFTGDPSAIVNQITFTGYGGATAISFGNIGGQSYYEIVPVPEPSSTALLGATGLLALVGFRDRRRFGISQAGK